MIILQKCWSHHKAIPVALNDDKLFALELQYKQYEEKYIFCYCYDHAM